MNWHDQEERMQRAKREEAAQARMQAEEMSGQEVDPTDTSLIALVRLQKDTINMMACQIGELQGHVAELEERTKPENIDRALAIYMQRKRI